MKRKSILLELWTRPGMRYDINTDEIVPGKWRLYVRLFAGWPLIRWGWGLTR